MGPKTVLVAVVAALLAAGSVAMADEYRPAEFLGLDLSKAVLSPKLLGPPTEFAPVAVEAKSEPRRDRASEPEWARDELKTEPKEVPVQDVHIAHPHRAGHLAHVTPKAAAVVKPNSASRARLAHRHASPLDAQAMDTRIRKWPCRSSGGGICGWK